MPILLQLRKGDGGWKKVSLCRFFCWPEDREFIEKMRFVASYSTSNKLLLIARHIIWLQASKNAFKVGSVKFTNSLSRLPLWRRYAPEVKAAKGLKRCRAKVKGVNNPAWIAQYMSFPSCEYRQAAAGFRSKHKLMTDTVHGTGRRHAIVLMVITVSMPETKTNGVCAYHNTNNSNRKTSCFLLLNIHCWRLLNFILWFISIYGTVLHSWADWLCSHCAQF